jgi:hypothetical protein
MIKYNIPEIGNKWFVLKLVLDKRVVERLKGFGQESLVNHYTKMLFHQNTTYHRIETKLFLEVKHED